MSSVLLETLSTVFRKARVTSTTDTSFPSRVPTVTEPTGTGNAAAQTTSSVIDIGKGGISCQNSVLVVPYGIGSNANTFSLRVIGWRRVGTDPTQALWIPVHLCELLVTLTSSMTGVAGCTIINTELFAGIISLTTGNANVSTEVVSGFSTLAAHAVVDMKGFQKLELTFTTGGSATDCNSLLALF